MMFYVRLGRTGFGGGGASRKAGGMPFKIKKFESYQGRQREGRREAELHQMVATRGQTEKSLTPLPGRNRREGNRTSGEPISLTPWGFAGGVPIEAG